MKVPCAVQICHRDCVLLRGQKPQAYSIAKLTLCHNPEKNEKVEKKSCVILSSQQNPAVAKYYVYKNIEKFFTSHIRDGKATIRFIQPPCDIIISKAIPADLKSFLHAVRLSVDGQQNEEVHFSQLPTKVQPEKKRLTIVKRENYPLTSGFPSSLTHVEIHNCALRKIDHRILCLKNLTSLNLAQNNLSELPLSLSELPLKVLNLDDNKIKKFPKQLSTGTLGKTLHALFLSNNQIEELDPFFCQMENLFVLSLHHNVLKTLPQNIHLLQSLKNLDISSNPLLKVLPYGLSKLHLLELNVFDNKFVHDHHSFTPEEEGKVPSLLEYAATYILKNKVPYGVEDLPPQLIEYLTDHSFCNCGNYAFQKTAFIIMSVELKSLAATVVHSHDIGIGSVPLQVHICPFQRSQHKLFIEVRRKSNKILLRLHIFD